MFIFELLLRTLKHVLDNYSAAAAVIRNSGFALNGHMHVFFYQYKVSHI